MNQRNPESIHPPLGVYSHQVEVKTGSRLLTISGQVGRTPEGRVPDDPIEQVSIALENIRRNLVEAGMDVADVIKLNWYVVGQIDLDRRREVMSAWLGGHAAPASTLVYVAGLVSPEYRVEIEAWAAK